MNPEDINENEPVDNIEADIVKAMNPEEEKAETPETQPSEVAEQQPVEPVVEKIAPPASWSGVVKEKWDALPLEVQAEISKREEEIHKGFTKHDEERTFGRSIKEMVSPYMPIIQAEGGTPEKAISSLLNTAYVLRTGTPEQKLNLLKVTAEAYGVDVAKLAEQQEYVDPTISQALQEIERLKELTNPEVIKNQLRQEAENASILSEVNAFAADTVKNPHYAKVKEIMANLLGTGQAKDLREAYDNAVWAHPETRSLVLQQQQAEDAAKRKSELEAKKKAGSSIHGSPAVNVGNSNSPNDETIEDSVRRAYAQAGGSI